MSRSKFTDSAAAQMQADRPDPEGLAAEIRRRLGPPPDLPRGWPLVSIVVPNRDGADRLRRLLAGLSERTEYPSLELILVDNASSDESLDFIRTVEAPFPISILANHHNESFSDACNQGAELAGGELLLFLNNDAEPFESGWLRELVACKLELGAGAVGATLIQPAEGGGSAHGYLVQQRGLLLREKHDKLASGFRDHMANPLGECLGEDVDPLALSAACLLLDRDAFERVGGFTHGYMYGGEDVDLSLKLRAAGLGLLCSGKSILIHGQGATEKAAESPQTRAWVPGNRDLLLERWGPQLRREQEANKSEHRGLTAATTLGYCVKAGDPRTPRGTRCDPKTEDLLEALQKALADGGRRCLILRGDCEARAGRLRESGLATPVIRSRMPGRSRL